MAPVPWNLSRGLLKITRRYKSDVRATSDDERVLCRLRSPSAVEIFGGTSDPPIIFLPPVSSCVVGKCFTALSSSCSLFEACSWLLHPGGNCLDRNKMKSHPMTLCQLFNRAVIYSSSCFHVLFPSFQTARRCLPTCCCGRTVHYWSHVTHNVMTVSLNNVSIIEGDGSGDRNSGNEKTVSLFLCPIWGHCAL